MRRLTPALVMVLAACSTIPKTTPIPVATKPSPRPNGELVGLTVHELGQRFGQPQFQVQEGPGTKLQWAGGGCVLDVYLYPPGERPGRGSSHLCRRAPPVRRGH